MLYIRDAHPPRDSVTGVRRTSSLRSGRSSPQELPAVPVPTAAPFRPAEPAAVSPRRLSAVAVRPRAEQAFRGRLRCPGADRLTAGDDETMGDATPLIVRR